MLSFFLGPGGAQVFKQESGMVCFAVSGIVGSGCTAVPGSQESRRRSWLWSREDSSGGWSTEMENSRQIQAVLWV